MRRIRNRVLAACLSTVCMIAGAAGQAAMADSRSSVEQPVAGISLQLGDYYEEHTEAEDSILDFLTSLLPKAAKAKPSSYAVMVQLVEEDAVEEVAAAPASSEVITDELLQKQLKDLMIEADDGKRIYEEKLAALNYRSARLAIEYSIEMLSSYIQLANEAGYPQTAANAQAYLDQCCSLRDQVRVLEAEQETAPTTPPSTEPAAPATEPAAPATDLQRR